MGKPITIGQSHNLVSVLVNNVDWNELDSDVAQRIIENPKDSGARFTAFLKNGGRAITSPGGILPVDRSKSFNSVKFIGMGWSIWKGPADGDGLSGAEEQDERSLALTEVDLAKVRLESYLGHLGGYITGKVALARAKEMKHVCLDAKVSHALWENQHLIPESWKEKAYIFFDGTVLRSPHGTRCVLFLYWRGGQWDWLCSWLVSGRDVEGPSAVLAS